MEQLSKIKDNLLGPLRSPGAHGRGHLPNTRRPGPAKGLTLAQKRRGASPWAASRTPSRTRPTT